jgi:hypothetical protein
MAVENMYKEHDYGNEKGGLLWVVVGCILQWNGRPSGMESHLAMTMAVAVIMTMAMAVAVAVAVACKSHIDIGRGMMWHVAMWQVASG